MLSTFTTIPGSIIQIIRIKLVFPVHSKGLYATFISFLMNLPLVTMMLVLFLYWTDQEKVRMKWRKLSLNTMLFQRNFCKEKIEKSFLWNDTSNVLYFCICWFSKMAAHIKARMGLKLVLYRSLNLVIDLFHAHSETQRSWRKLANNWGIEQ